MCGAIWTNLLHPNGARANMEAWLMRLPDPAELGSGLEGTLCNEFESVVNSANIIGRGFH